MKNVTPMRDLMVVEKEARSEMTAGGILLPNAVNDDPTAQGRVITVGEGAFDEKTGQIMELDVKVGDVVLFHHNAGIKVSEHKETPERWLLREEDILAIVVP